MTQRDRKAWALLSLSFVLVACWLGGALPAAAILFSLSSALLLGLTYLRSSREITKLSPLSVYWLAASVLTLLQIIPLPFGLVEILSPGRANVAETLARALGEPIPSWAALSVDGSATLFEGSKALAALCISYVGSRVAVTTQGRVLLAKTLVSVALLFVALGSLHLIFSLSRLYGFYVPEQNLFGFLTPLLNTNHLGIFLALGTCVSLGLTLERKNGERIFWGVSSLVLTIASLYQRSRGASLAILLGFVVFGLLIFYMRPRDGERRRTNRRFHFGGAILALCALALVVGLSYQNLSGEFGRTSVSEVTGAEPGKIALWRSSETLLWAYNTTGVGRGAFESAFTPYAPEASLSIYSHVENEYLQYLLDWGLLGGLVMLALFAWVTKRALRRATKSPLHAGAAAGMLALAIHSFADFALALPAVIFGWTFVVSILSPASLTRSSKSLSWAKPARLGVSLLTLLSGLALLLPSATSLRSDRSTLMTRAQSSLTTEAIDRLKRHPGDFYISARLAEIALKTQNPSVIPLINHSLLRHPTFSGSHLVAARALTATNHLPQACLEYRQALEFSDDPTPVVDELLAELRGLELRACVSTRPASALAFAGRVAQDNPKLAKDILQASAERYRENAKLLVALGNLESKIGAPEEAEDSLRRAYEQSPNFITTQAWVSYLAHSGQLPKAVVTANEAVRTLERARDRTRILLTVASAQIASKDFGNARATLERAEASSEMAQDLLRLIHLERALLEDALGNNNLAEWERKRAAEYSTR